MDQNSLITILVVFVGIAAVALATQAVALLGIFLALRQIRAKVFAIWPQMEEITAITKRTAQGAEEKLAIIGATSVTMLDLAKQQLVKADSLLSDASTRARVQMERAEMVLDDTMTRVQSTVSVVQRGVLRPIREVHGVVSGVRTAIQHFGRSSRSTVDHATADEEMFI